MANSKNTDFIRGRDRKFRERLKRGPRELTPEQKKLGAFYKDMRQLAQRLAMEQKQNAL